MVGAMPGCAWGWLRPSRAVDSRAAQSGGLGKREAGEPAPCLSHQPGVHRCGINHLVSAALDPLVGESGLDLRVVFLDCEDELLRRRYTETRRRHPLAGDRGNWHARP